MSFNFNINPPGQNLSNVQASSKSLSGGGGNTGYFRRDGGEEENKKYLESENDTFQKGDIVFEDEEEMGFMTLFLRFIEELVEKIKNLFVPKKEQEEELGKNYGIADDTTTGTEPEF